jgi:hypothetical protein
MKMAKRKKKEKQERKERLNNLERASKQINKSIGGVNDALNKSMAKTHKSIGW